MCVRESKLDKIEKWKMCYVLEAPSAHPSTSEAPKGVKAPASRKRSVPIPTEKSASAPQKRSASEHTSTSSTDPRTWCVGTQLRKSFNLWDFESTIANVLGRASYIWVEGEVTRIRNVSYRTQYTCLFKDGNRSKEVNEFDVSTIGLWIRSYQKKYNVVPPSEPTPKSRPPSDDTPSTDEGKYCVGTNLRKKFPLSDFENTPSTIFTSDSHIWLDGKVTKIRCVNSRIQYTCAFPYGQRCKLVNESDIKKIEQWIHGYQRRHKEEDPPSAPPQRRPHLRPPPAPAPKPALASLLVPGKEFPTTQGTTSCYRENNIHTEFFLTPIVMSGLEPTHYAYAQHSSPHPLKHPHPCLHLPLTLRV